MTRILCALLLGVAACASNGKPAPKEPEPRTAPIAPGKGRIYFFRNDKVTAKAIQPKVYLAGEVVGQARPGTYFFVDRMPGLYEAKTAVLTEHAINFQVKAGETIYVEIRMRMGVYAGHALPTIVDAETGKAAVNKYRYSGRG